MVVIEPLVLPSDAVFTAAKYSLPFPSTQIKPTFSTLPLSIIIPASLTGLFTVPDDKTINGSLTTTFSDCTVVELPVTVRLPLIVTSPEDKLPVVDKLLAPKFIPFALVEVILPLLTLMSPISADVPTVKLVDTEAAPVTVVAPNEAVPVVSIALSLNDIVWLESVICPSANVNVPNWDPDAPVMVPEKEAFPVAVTFPAAVMAPVSRVPEVLILSSWKLTLPEADLIVPVVNVISATFVPEARDNAAVVVINLSPKLIVVPSVVMAPSLIVISPNLEPEAPVIVPEALTFPVIVVAPAAKVPVVEIAVVSSANAPVVFILLSVITTFPNVPPEVPVMVPDADISPVTVVAPATNVPVVEIFSSSKLIAPDESVIEPPATVIVPAITLLPTDTLFVTDKPFANDISPPTVISLKPRLIPLALVDVILPLLIDISPISADVPTDKSVVIPALPVIVVAPAANVPVVDTPEVSRVKAPVVFILLSVTSTLPNVPPKEPVTNPEDDIFPVTVVAPAANVPVVEIFSSPKLIAPDVSVIDPLATVIVPATTLPPADTLLVTVIPLLSAMSPPTVISLEPRLIPLALVDVILPLLIDISPISADVPTDKSELIPTLPVILVDPAAKVPVVDRLLESKLIPGPEETTEPELNVRLPTFNVLATVATPSIDVAPATDNVAPINLSASRSPVVVILPSVVILVVPNVTVPSVSVILPSEIVVLPTLNDPAVTLLVVAILLPTVSVSVAVVILPVVNVISPKTLPEAASIVPLISNPLDAILPAESYTTAVSGLTTPGDTPTSLLTSAATSWVPVKIFRLDGVAVNVSLPIVNPVPVIDPALKSPATATFPVVNVKISTLDNWILFWSISKLSTATLPAVTFSVVVISFWVLIVPKLVSIEPAVNVPTVEIVDVPV